MNGDFRSGTVTLHGAGHLLSEAMLAKGPEQPEPYHYNRNGHRVFEGWKTSKAVRDLAYHPDILDGIEALTGSSARPFQTIGFDRGSNQPLHQDAIHFQTFPREQIIGAWIALEDIHPDSGPLLYVPESAGMPFIDFGTLGLPVAGVGEQYADYARYEDFMRNLVAVNRWEPVPFLAKAGDAFLWGVEMLHGGAPILDPSLTRRSLVVHYYLDDVEYAYAPMFGIEECPYRKSGRWFSKDGRLHELSEQA